MANRIKSLSGRRPSSGNIDWNSVVLRAKDIVEAFPTSVTLRQLYYRLVSEGLIPNNQNMYKNLSRKTAQARREGWFPDLIDRTREIERFAWWDSPRTAMEQMVSSYMRDRTEGQEYSVYLGVEKHGMSVQLMDWFGELGIPILALGGYSSQTFVDVVRDHAEKQDRPCVLLYAGDFDPSGMDIDRDFEERTDIFDQTVRVALRREHIEEYDLPPMPGKEDDSRSASFILEHGQLIQVELDALNPDDLRKLYQDQLDRFWDKDVYDEVLEREANERDHLMFFFKHVDMIPSDIAVNIVNRWSADDELDWISDALADRYVLGR